MHFTFTVFDKNIDGFKNIFKLVTQFVIQAICLRQKFKNKVISVPC